MNMFARFDENPAMTLRVIKETKRYGRTDAQTDGHTDGRTDNVKTVYPLQTKFAGGIKTLTSILLQNEQHEQIEIMANHGPLCKRIKNDKENLLNSIMWKRQKI